MKKRNLLFSFIVIIILIFDFYVLTLIYNYNTTKTNENKTTISIEKVHESTKPATEELKKEKTTHPFKVKPIDRDLTYFVGENEIGCFLSILNTLGYAEDVDSFYYKYVGGFTEANEVTEIQGKIFPSVLETIANTYFEDNKMNMIALDISDYTDQHLYDVIKNGTPNVVWYKDKAYIVSNCIEKSENLTICLTDYRGKTIKVKSVDFFKNWDSAVTFKKIK